jgi:G3E family GTPase
VTATAAAVTERVPVMVLTGFLGAGKTTLLNRILSGDGSRRYAVIVNELGEIGIDGDLIVRTEEELIEMSNGCICCSVRGDLVRTLHQLLARRGTFDCIVIETTGVAHPGPVIQTFFIDHVLKARIVLDSVTTVVDAAHIERCLADTPAAAEQIAFADQIILNKTELVGGAELEAVAARLRALNPFAPIHPARRAAVDLGRLLGHRGVGEQLLGLRQFAAAAHDDGIGSVSLTSHTPLDGAKLSDWLEDLVAAHGADILRGKGIFDLQGEARQLVFQSVHRLLEADFQREWRPQEPRFSRLVFIGRNLDRPALAAGLAACEHAA